MVKTPQSLEFKVTDIKPVETTDDGRTFLECRTSVGTVAFWGDDDSTENIEQVQARRVPFRVRTQCVHPDPPFDRRHSLWVQRRAHLEFL